MSHFNQPTILKMFRFELLHLINKPRMKNICTIQYVMLVCKTITSLGNVVLSLLLKFVEMDFSESYNIICTKLWDL